MGYNKLGNRDWALMNRISALVKVTHRLPYSFYHVKTVKNTLHEPGSRFLPDTKSAVASS